MAIKVHGGFTMDFAGNPADRWVEYKDNPVTSIRQIGGSFMRKRKSFTKIVSMLLLLTMVLSLLAACGDGGNQPAENTGGGDTKQAADSGDSAKQDGGDEAAAPEEPVHITMLYSDNANYPAQDDWLILEEFRKRKNVILDLESVPESDYESRRTVSFNSGDMPDIISKTFAYHVSPYISAGLFLPISV